MNIDLGSFAFGSSLVDGVGTPSWGTALGQSKPDYYITRDGANELVMGMVYKSVPLTDVSLPLGRGGKMFPCDKAGTIQLTSLFEKVYVNGARIEYPFIMVLQKEDSDSHSGRRGVKYTDKAEYHSGDINYTNAKFIEIVREKFGLFEGACWFVYDISVLNHEELHMKAIFVNKEDKATYENSRGRSEKWIKLIEESGESYSIVEKKIQVADNLPLQTIFYGAPGTGKSHKVKEETDTLPKSDVFRTTFHPDSDYSTFVGCYKPKMVKAPIRDGSGHEITSACEDEKKRIAYEYEPQAFLKAYVRAYETSEPVFMVIEEINRGNCAQIFGDMFQLLDRSESGESDYAIKPETAIQEFLNEKLKDCDIADETIKSGEEMRLPANLHIWATMNTSDQSLFPIDSAFKRRWDWKYVPINTRKESWSIKVNGAEYSWSDFLEKINAEIDVVTHSEDKKLGFYFCKAENGVISAEKFVSKVLFYIYNDVFKDYGFDKDIFNDTDGKLSFGKFYQENGDIQKDKVALFLNNLGVGSTGATEEETDIEYDTADAGKAEHKETLVAVTINGERLTADGMTQFDLYLNAIKKIGVDKVGPALEAMKYRRKGSPMATKNKVQSLLKSDGYSYVEADGYYFVKGARGYTLVRILEDLNKDLNLNIMIEFR